MSDQSADSREQTEVSVMRIAGQRYHDTTTVYTSGSGAEIFHADRRCSHLLNSGPEWSDTVHLTAYALPEVLSSYLTPYKRCRRCTLPMQKTVRVAVQQDGMDPALLKYYEPGDTKVTTEVRRDPDTGEKTVQKWTEKIRPDGGEQA